MSPGAGHLPNRGGVQARDGVPAHLPRQRRGMTPQGHGRYPDYDVLRETGHWDEPTRAVVLDRVASPPPVRFFSSAEARTLRAFCDVVMAQGSEPRIPVLEMVDAKFHAGKLDGYRHHDLPEDPDTWRQVAASLEASAREEGCEEGFAAAPVERQQEIVGRFSEGKLEWPGLPVKKAWTVVMRSVLAAFYSHPWAWNEIGFGGPAYPRGYARMGRGQREHWERPPALSPDPVTEAREGELG